MKVLIIGGGASGMMAALSALENPENTVTLLERQSRVGKKLLATGNGRCNLTNRNIRLSRYHGEQPEFARFALEIFYVGRTLAFFERLGLLTVTEDSGKVYPLSDQASHFALCRPIRHRHHTARWDRGRVFQMASRACPCGQRRR